MDKKWSRDLGRLSQQYTSKVRMTLGVLRNPGVRFCYYLRKEEHHRSDFGGFIWAMLKRKLGYKLGIEMDGANIGGGMLLVHPFAITINSNATVGEDLTIFKGATIGSVRSGSHRGVPCIGDRVTICACAMVCGGITIGDDVLIAANSFVNFDVPSNSVVIGNPAIIHPKNQASYDYLNQTIHGTGEDM